MQIKDVMAHSPITVSPDETVLEAARKMRNANVGCLIVTNEGAVAGVITDRDFVVRCISEADDAADCTISPHMSSPAITASPSMDVLDAVHLMTERQVKRLPVVEDGRLVGLVSLSDIAKAMDQPMHDLLLGMGAARRAA